MIFPTRCETPSLELLDIPMGSPSGNAPSLRDAKQMSLTVGYVNLVIKLHFITEFAQSYTILVHVECEGYSCHSNVSKNKADRVDR